MHLIYFFKRCVEKSFCWKGQPGKNTDSFAVSKQEINDLFVLLSDSIILRVRFFKNKNVISL